MSLFTPPWLPDARCAGENPDMFFGEHGKFSSAKTKEAIKICRECPVVKKCLSWALETGDSHAVLGGMTPSQRTRYRRELDYNAVRKVGG